jgi:hypothetical protein
VQMYILILVHYSVLVNIIKLLIVCANGTRCTDIPNDVIVVLRNNTFGCNVLNFARLLRGAIARIKQNSKCATHDKSQR